MFSCSPPPEMKERRPAQRGTNGTETARPKASRADDSISIGVRPTQTMTSSKCSTIARPHIAGRIPTPKKSRQRSRLLSAGKIVAWCQGAAEFGPRALGNRSLLASPWAPFVRENLNDYVKHRESFRPFALAVPAEDAARFFESTPAARFMASMGVVKTGSASDC